VKRRELIALAAALAGGARALRAATIPRPATPLEFVSNLGAKVRLSDLKGKVVVVEWMLTTCPHCQRSSVVLSKLQTEYGPRGLQVIGVAINQDAGRDMAKYATLYATTFPIGMGTHPQASDWLQVPPMVRMLMPQLAIVDRKGMIVEQHAGDDEKFFANEEALLRASIEKLLGPAKSSATKAGGAKKK
jgi:thiol-disulfide isomerase/thioredoxin